MRLGRLHGRPHQEDVGNADQPGAGARVQGIVGGLDIGEPHLERRFDLLLRRAVAGQGHDAGFGRDRPVAAVRHQLIVILRQRALRHGEADSRQRYEAEREIRRAPLRQESTEPSGHEQGDEQVQRQQRRRKAEQRPREPQRARLGVAEQTRSSRPFADQFRLCAGAGVQGTCARRALIEAGRVDLGGHGRVELRRLDRRGVRARAGEAAKSVERQLRHVGAFGVLDRLAAPGGDRAAQHLFEQARIGKVRPVRPGGDMEQDQHAAAARIRGHQRRAIGKPRPGLAREFRIRRRQNLLPYTDIFRNGQSEEGRGVRKRGKALRLFPGERAAQRARRASQAHRQQLVALRGEARPGKADQRAAVFHPFGEDLDIRRRNLSDIGQDDRIRRRRHDGLDIAARNRGEGLQRLADVVHVGQQGLRRRAGIDEACAARAVDRIPKPDRARAGASGHVEPRDAGERRGRNLELGSSLRFSGRKQHFAGRDGRSVARLRRDEGARRATRIGAREAHRDGVGLGGEAGDRHGPFGRRGEHGQRRAFGKVGGEGGAAAILKPVARPENPRGFQT